MSPLALSAGQLAVSAVVVAVWATLLVAAVPAIREAHRRGVARVRAADARRSPAERHAAEVARFERAETWGAWADVRRSGAHTRTGRSWDRLPKQREP